jgi:hypothetical protein
LSDDLGQNDIKEEDNLSHHEIEPTIKPNKEPHVINKGDNVYSGDDEILADYAVKHKAKSVSAYIAKLKETGSAAKIIKEYKQKRFIAKRAENAQKETESLLRLYASYEKDAVMPETCTAWDELGKKLGIQKKL